MLFNIFSRFVGVYEVSYFWPITKAMSGIKKFITSIALQTASPPHMLSNSHGKLES